MFKNGRSLFFAILLGWLLINWLQAAFTELDPDEAYYWMYSKVLAWGYFDHPPFLALLINAGYGIFPSELGVRLIVALLQPLSFYLIWLTLDKPSQKTDVMLLLLLLGAMPVLQVYGFIATPDGPLLLFTSLFFYVYKRFLIQENLSNAILLGLCMAALLYSKYHGVLLIFFVTLSNLELLKKKYFYYAGILGLILFIPHLYWQYLHDFPSFRYHLSGRNDPYVLRHTTEYIISQLIVFSPFMVPLIAYGLYRTKITDRLVRAFYFVIFGFLLFFLWTSSKGRVEPHWTALLSIPFVILLYQQAQLEPLFRTWLQRMSIVTIILIAFGRLLLVFPLVDLGKDFHNTQWVYDLKANSKGRPIIFENSYRDVSKYIFYSGDLAYTFTDLEYRKNQYDIWDWEKHLQGKSVLFAGQRDWDCSNCKLTELGKKKFMLKYAEDIQISQKVEFLLPDVVENWKSGSSVALPIQAVNPYDHEVNLNKGNMPLSIEALFFSEKTDPIIVPAQLAINPEILPANDTLNTKIEIMLPGNLEGTYSFYLGIRTGDLPVAFNSKQKRIIIAAKK